MSDWTEDALATLKRRRFAPGAWFGFLRSSFRRAAELRRGYPAAHRTVVRLAAAGAVVSLVVALTGRPLLGWLSAAWWLAVCSMADWHLGLLDDLPRFGFANTLSLMRAGLVPAIVLLGPSPAAAALFAAAGATDVVDGLVARAGGEATRLGRWLDGSVDGLVLSAAAVVALPAWAAALVVARYLLAWIAIGGFYLVRARRPPLEGFVSGRLPGAVAFAGLLLGLLELPAAPPIAAAGALAGLATFTASALRTRAVAASAR